MARTEASSIIDQIHDHAGACYFIRRRQRFFTLKIFCDNTFDLQAHLDGYTHPNQFATLFAEKNRHLNSQAHGHIVRLFHNFLCASQTIIDHTRNLIKEHYLGTTVNQEYSKKIARIFAENELTKFIQDLRNYVVHNGLPPIVFGFTGTAVAGSNDGSCTIESYFHLNVDDFIKWDRWTKLSRDYLRKSEGKINLRILVREYSKTIDSFHHELDVLFSVYHQKDIEDLKSLQERTGYHIFTFANTETNGAD